MAAILIGALWESPAVSLENIHIACFVGLAIFSFAVELRPDLVSRFNANAWSSQARWNFGPDSFEFQAVLYRVFHTALVCEAAHWTIFTDALGWFGVVYYYFHTTGLFVLCGFLMFQYSTFGCGPLYVLGCSAVHAAMSVLVSTSWVGLGLVAGNAMATAGLSGAAAAAGNEFGSLVTAAAADGPIISVRASTILIAVGTLSRVIGHAYAEVAPPLVFEPFATTAPSKSQLVFRYEDGVAGKAFLKHARRSPRGCLILLWGPIISFLSEMQAGLPVRLLPFAMYIPMYYVAPRLLRANETVPATGVVHSSAAAKKRRPSASSSGAVTPVVATGGNRSIFRHLPAAANGMNGDAVAVASPPFTPAGSAPATPIAGRSRRASVDAGAGAGAGGEGSGGGGESNGIGNGNGHAVGNGSLVPSPAPYPKGFSRLPSDKNLTSAPAAVAAETNGSGDSGGGSLITYAYPFPYANGDPPEFWRRIETIRSVILKQGWAEWAVTKQLYSAITSTGNLVLNKQIQTKPPIPAADAAVLYDDSSDDDGDGDDAISTVVFEPPKPGPGTGVVSDSSANVN